MTVLSTNGPIERDSDTATVLSTNGPIGTRYSKGKSGEMVYPVLNI